MKIAILTSVFYQKVKEVHGEDRIIFGGAERYLYDLYNLLKRLGHEVTVYQGLTGTNSYVIKNFKGMKVVCLPIQEEDYTMHTLPVLNTKFYEVSLSYDLRIYFASFLATPMVKSPSICVHHGIFWDYHGSIYERNNRSFRQDFLEVQAEAIKNCDLCVGVDTNIKNFYMATDINVNNKIMYIPNYADTEVFKPRETKKDWERLRILYPRRLVHIRGLNNFLTSALELPEYDFILCGQPFDEELEKEISMYEKMSPNIKAMYIDMQGMESVYQNVDIAVVPTRGSEGTSLSLIEAMSTGLPVIATPYGGLPNLVIDGYNGFLVDVWRESLTPYIKKLAEDKQLSETFGKRNREIVLNSFSKELWEQKWIKALEYVL